MVLGVSLTGTINAGWTVVPDSTSANLLLLLQNRFDLLLRSTSYPNNAKSRLASLSKCPFQTPIQIIQHPSPRPSKIIHLSPHPQPSHSGFIGGSVSCESINLLVSKSGNSHSFNASVVPFLVACNTQPQNP